MTDTSIQQVSPNSTALNAENYQTFEMAKANDDVLSGDNIAQIRSYAAYARAQAQAIHKTIAATSGIDDVAAIKAEATETAQTFAKVGIYADQRIGEILRELPKGKGNQYKQSAEVGTPTKAQAIKEANIDHHTAIDLQAMAANPEVVQAVIDKATADGKVVSRNQVIKAIKERDRAREDLEDAYMSNEVLEREIDNLKRKVEEKPEPKVIEREVEVVREVVPEDVQRRIESLEYYKNLGEKDNATLRKQLEETRKKLDRAKVLLDGKNHIDNASWDISVLTTATNNYLSQYGGKAWAFEQFDHADEVTQREFVKAIASLAAFSQNLVQMISDKNKLEA